MAKSFFIVNQTCYLDVECENKIAKHQFYVYDDLKHDVLIGLDLMESIKLNIEWEQIEEIPRYHFEQKLVYEIKMIRNTRIPKQSYATISFSIPSCERYGIFKPTKELYEKYKAHADHAILEL